MSGLPHSPDVESALIAKLLVDPAAIPPLVGTLTAEDFWDEAMGKAWSVMEANAGDPRRVDINVLRSSGVIIDDPLEFLNRGTGAPAEEYARLIRLDALRRRAITSLRSAEKQVRTADEPGVFDAVQSAVSGILSQHRGGSTLIPWSEAIDLGIEDEEGLSWGFIPLDRQIQPARAGQMVVLAARPSVGKTTVAEHMALYWARGADLPVLFVSVEMTVGQLMSRARARYGNLDPSTYTLYWLDEPRCTTSLVRSQASRLRLRHGGVRAIVIDYLQLLRDPGEPEHIRVGRISAECKAMAREFECPVLVLSQLNRLSEQRDDRRPRLSDLRDSGAIEQDADIVLGLYRPSLDSHDLSLGVLKNRHGRAGAWVELFFDLSNVRVE